MHEDAKVLILVHMGYQVQNTWVIWAFDESKTMGLVEANILLHQQISMWEMIWYDGLWKTPHTNNAVNFWQKCKITPNTPDVD